MEVLKSEKNEELDKTSVGKYLNFTIGSTKATVYYQWNQGFMILVPKEVIVFIEEFWLFFNLLIQQ